MCKKHKSSMQSCANITHLALENLYNNTVTHFVLSVGPGQLFTNPAAMSYFLWTPLSILGALGLYFWSKQRKSARFWPDRSVALAGSDVTVSVLEYMKNPLLQHEIDCKVYSHLKNKTKEPFIGLIEMGTPVLFVSDLDLARQIFIKDFDVFTNRRKLPGVAETDPTFFKMLFFMEDEPWRELRSKMTPTFTTGKIRRMFGIFKNYSQELVKHLEATAAKDPEQEVDFRDSYERYTMGTISSAAFGVDAKTFEEKKSIFQEMGKKLQLEGGALLFITYILMVFAPKLAKALNLGFMDKKTDSFFTNVIKGAIRHRQETGEVREDFLQLMLEARSGQLKAEADESEEGGISGKGNKDKVALVELTDDVIVAQSVLFIIAGFDSTQSVLLFCVYELALNPEIQQRLSDEIETALENGDGELNYEMINHLEYLDKVVSETMRKFPSETRLERRTNTEYKIPGTDVVLPKDVMVFVPTYSIHHDPAYYPDPERFDPERFSKEVKNARHPTAYLPFGVGPRNCIGMRFALTNVKMAIASIVHNFVLEPSAKTLIPMKFSTNTSLRPESMFLKVTPRN